MKQEQTNCVVYEGNIVPAAVLRRQMRDDKYGHVEGLADEELADPEELERVVYKEMWWPVLRMPQQRWECAIRPNIDEDGRVDWGVFGTVDFESYRPTLDKLRYKSEKLKEELKDLVFMLEMVSARIPGRAKFKVLRLVKAGVLDIGDISNNQMYFLAEMYLRGWRLRKQIGRMQEKSRQQRQGNVFWEKRGCV
ncbi:hypothetical protein ACFL6U_30375 [Planctomycetota bacterium]